nr:LOW QUALITY PROTEIN: endogenous retrovirus group K member 113 Env polyprotein-like [Chlorocebus sabaeus]
MNPLEMQRKAPPRRRKHRNRAPLTPMMNQVMASEEQMKSPHTKKAQLPTWAQLKKLTPLAGKSLASTKVTQTPEKMLLTALMMVSTVVSLHMPAGAAAANYTYWAYVPFPPLIRVVTWMDNPIEVYVNNSVWVPGPTDDRCPAKPEEEGMMINISTGYRYPPICLGRAPGCLMLAIQNWLVEVPTVSPTSRFTYHMHHILLVRAREGVWIPVSMDRPWEASPSIHILTEVLKVCRTSRRILRQNRENEQAFIAMAHLYRGKGRENIAGNRLKPIFTVTNRTRPAQTGFDPNKPDSNRTRPAENVFDQLKHNQTISNQTQTRPDRLKRTQTGPDQLKPVLTVSIRTRPAQTGFDQIKPDLNRSRPAENGFDRLKPDQTGSNRF